MFINYYKYLKYKNKYLLIGGSTYITVLSTLNKDYKQKLATYNLEKQDLLKLKEASSSILKQSKNDLNILEEFKLIDKLDNKYFEIYKNFTDLLIYIKQYQQLYDLFDKFEKIYKDLIIYLKNYDNNGIKSVLNSIIESIIKSLESLIPLRTSSSYNGLMHLLDVFENEFKKNINNIIKLLNEIITFIDELNSTKGIFKSWSRYNINSKISKNIKQIKTNKSTLTLKNKELFINFKLTLEKHFLNLKKEDIIEKTQKVDDIDKQLRHLISSDLSKIKQDYKSKLSTLKSTINMDSKLPNDINKINLLFLIDCEIYKLKFKISKEKCDIEKIKIAFIINIINNQKREYETDRDKINFYNNELRDYTEILNKLNICCEYLIDIENKNKEIYMINIQNFLKFFNTFSISNCVEMSDIIDNSEIKEFIRYNLCNLKRYNFLIFNNYIYTNYLKKFILIYMFILFNNKHISNELNLLCFYLFKTYKILKEKKDLYLFDNENNIKKNNNEKINKISKSKFLLKLMEDIIKSVNLNRVAYIDRLKNHLYLSNSNENTDKYPSINDTYDYYFKISI